MIAYVGPHQAIGRCSECQNHHRYVAQEYDVIATKLGHAVHVTDGVHATALPYRHDFFKADVKKYTDLRAAGRPAAAS